MKRIYSWVTVIILVTFAGGALAQDAQTSSPQQPPPSQSNAPYVPYNAPGVYTNSGHETYGPNGRIQLNNGNQTQTQGSRGSGPTYSTYGNYTLGTDGSEAVTYGNRTYQNNGIVSETHGNQVYTYKPNGQTQVCSTYGSKVVCR